LTRSRRFHSSITGIEWCKAANEPLLIWRWGPFDCAVQWEWAAMEILYSSNELRDAIKKVLANPEADDRRVVLVAYVGGQAQALLPDPKGLEIICWLKPGSSDPLTIERLKKRGAKVYKSESLHMKVYWSSRRGCVIGSANASGNALGGGIQKEAGVWLPPNIVDIQRLWDYAKPKLIKRVDLVRLTLEGERAPSYYPSLTREQPPNFLEWRTSSSRRDWKLGSWDEVSDFAKEAVAKARLTYGVKHPSDYLFVKQGELKDTDWALSFKVPSVTSIGWMYVDFLIPVSSSDECYDKDYPFQAVQVHPVELYRPPFKLDQPFCNAFKKAIKAFGVEEIDAFRCRPPPKQLLDLIARNMTS
jgi:hypothetical protein